MKTQPEKITWSLHQSWPAHQRLEWRSAEYSVMRMNLHRKGRLSRAEKKLDCFNLEEQATQIIFDLWIPRDLLTLPKIDSLLALILMCLILSATIFSQLLYCLTCLSVRRKMHIPPRIGSTLAWYSRRRSTGAGDHCGRNGNAGWGVFLRVHICWSRSSRNSTYCSAKYVSDDRFEKIITGTA